MSASLLEVFLRYPTTAGVRYSYGTAGFRGVGNTLISTACRMGALMVLRHVLLLDPARSPSSCVGIAITASHNPHADNGLKLIDVNGGMLDPSWEKHTEALANAPTAEAAVAYINDLAKELGIADKLSGGRVHVARDTRPTGVGLSRACIEAIRALGAEAIDYGELTTPQVHFTVLQALMGKPHAESDYVSSIVDAFRALWGAVKEGESPTKLIVDCANGVGALKLPAVADRLRDVLDIELVNTDTATPTILNEKCGADYIQKNVQMPPNVSPEKSLSHHVVSFDGDADRIVYLVNVDGTPRLLDGDRILVILTRFVRRLLADAGLCDTDMAIVQTAYANGGSTKYIQDTLGVPVIVSPTGVKYCHAAAHKASVGVYFEANGHGTVLFNEAFQQKLQALNTPEAAKLLSLSVLLSQVCGDAIGDMLAVELALRDAGVTPAQWLELYDDLPSRQLKVTVPDPKRITNTWEQTRVVEPALLQDKIDAAVALVRQPCRAFVRPSGTEPIVRVYAEAPTREECDGLADAVKKAVEEVLA
eukprot:PhM_4_TR8185/c0_g1_i1/m.81980/K01836/PGM3; phosphoacetylglucosamine mutase